VKDQGHSKFRTRTLGIFENHGLRASESEVTSFRQIRMIWWFTVRDCLV